MVNYLKLLYSVFRDPFVGALSKTVNDFKPFIRLQFFHAAMKVGLFEALSTPKSREELMNELGVKRAEILDVLLDLGMSLKEISKENELYMLCGKRSQVLSSEEGDPIAALIEEYVTLYPLIYNDLEEVLAGEPLKDYFAGSENLVAKSSRIAEPYLKDFIQNIIKKNNPERILDVGCGSGIYLRHAAKASPELKGVGIDLNEEVVNATRENMIKWGLEDRFEILQADIRSPGALGKFDMITLLNNIYYFPADQRSALFSGLLSYLNPGGILVIVSNMQGNTPLSVGFDLILRATANCYALPDLEETISQLEESGYCAKKEKLIPGQPFYAIIARRSEDQA